MIKDFTRHGWRYESQHQGRVDEEYGMRALTRGEFGYVWTRHNIDAMRPTPADRRYIQARNPTRADVVRAFED